MEERTQRLEELHIWECCNRDFQLLKGWYLAQKQRNKSEVDQQNRQSAKAPDSLGVVAFEQVVYIVHVSSV